MSGMEGHAGKAGEFIGMLTEGATAKKRKRIWDLQVVVTDYFSLLFPAHLFC